MSVRYAALFRFSFSAFHPQESRDYGWLDATYQVYFGKLRARLDEVVGKSDTKAKVSQVVTDTESAVDLLDNDSDWYVRPYVAARRATHIVALHLPTVELIGRHYPEFVVLDDTRAKLVIFAIVFSLFDSHFFPFRFGLKPICLLSSQSSLLEQLFWLDS